MLKDKDQHMSDPMIPSGPGNQGIQPTERAAQRVRPPMPRWVKIFGIVSIAVVLLMIGVSLLSGGQHGPARHLGASVVSGYNQQAPAGLT